MRTDEVECLFQALDELDDLLTILRQRWLRHGAEGLDATPRAAKLRPGPPLL
jgi:hypothetical protein